MFVMQEPFISAELAYRRERFRSPQALITENGRGAHKTRSRRYHRLVFGYRQGGAVAGR